MNYLNLNPPTSHRKGRKKNYNICNDKGNFFRFTLWRTRNGKDRNEVKDQNDENHDEVLFVSFSGRLTILSCLRFPQDSGLLEKGGNLHNPRISEGNNNWGT